MKVSTQVAEQVGTTEFCEVKEQTSGLGVHILTKEKKVEFLFEADDMAVDEAGKQKPAGVKLSVDITGALKPFEHYEALAIKIQIGGLPELGIQPGTMRRLTWEQYQEKGYQ